MLKKWLVLPAMSGILILTGCSSHKKDKIKDEGVAATKAYTMPVTQEGLTKVTESWPQSSKTAIDVLTAKYGLPNAVTDDMVIWNNTAPFKRSVVFREEIDHKFPMEHKDVLQQYVDYKVPQDKIDALAKFDGSVMVDRTKGELSARDEREEMNVLALNLADRIIRGEISPEEARRIYGRNAEAFAAGNSSQLITGLHFSSHGDTKDPDTSMQSQEVNSPTKRQQFKSKTTEEVIEEQQ